ncbi:MAG: hypothetical protein HY819_07570 [Acidobacteria bacterium]|nr:hypothetical protein [Acidobacteriota bacterium]
MIKEGLLIYKLFLATTLLFSLSFTTFAQNEPKKPRVVFTNDEFSTNPPKEPEKLERSENPIQNPSVEPTINNNSNTAKIEEMPAINLQIKALDIKLALAQDPQNSLLRQQQIDINTQLRQSALIKPSSKDLQDLTFKQRFIEIKIAIISLEKQSNEATTNIQKERRKIIKGSQGNSAFEGVRTAEDNVESLQKQIIKLQSELNTLIEEGRRLGVDAHIFR